MALKETISVWYDGVKAFEDGDFAGALDTFLSISDPSARILFNIARVSKLNDSVKYLTEAITKDPHLAVAYYQRGLHYFTKKQIFSQLVKMVGTGELFPLFVTSSVFFAASYIHCNHTGVAFDICSCAVACQRKHALELKFRLKWYDRALQDFISSEEKMHGRPVLDYSQLGMAFKLYSAEIAITKAAVWQRKGNSEHAIEMVITASQEAEEDTVKKMCVSALQKLQVGGQGALDPVKIHDHCIFHPPKSLTANLKKREYVAKSRVVSDYQQRSRESSPNPEGRQSANQPPDLPSRGGNHLPIPPDKPRKSHTLPGSMESSQGRARESNQLDVSSQGQKKFATMAGSSPTRHLPPPPKRAAPILSMNIKDSKSAEDLFTDKQNNSLSVEKHRMRRHSHDVPRDFDSQLTKALADQLKKVHVGEPIHSNNDKIKVKNSSDRNSGTPPPRPPRPPPPGIVIDSDNDTPPPVPRKDYPKP